MKSLTTPDFWKCYANLPPYIKQQAKKAYRLWISNVFHRSLHFKKVEKNVWSVRITENYRALALKKVEDYYWFRIGSHDEYEELIK